MGEWAEQGQAVRAEASAAHDRQGTSGRRPVALTPPSPAGPKDRLLLLPGRECHLSRRGRDAEPEGRHPAQLQG